MQDVGVFPCEDGVVVGGKHMEAVIELLDSSFDIVPSGVGLVMRKRQRLRECDEGRNNNGQHDGVR